MTASTRTFHRVLSSSGTGFDVGRDGAPARDLTFTPAPSTCPRSLSTAGTLRERLARLDRSNRDAAVKIALLRADNARLSATIASARKSPRTIPPRVPTVAAKQAAAVLAEPNRRIVVKNGMIYEDLW